MAEKWFLYCKKADFADIARTFHISPMLARILRNRDLVSYEEISKFLNGDTKDMYDPWLLKDMKKGVALMSDTIDRGERIRVIGDYDVDGVCASYILKTFILQAGGNVDVRLPDRILEGYGMNVQMAEEAREDGISLIITCDNGISSLDAVARAKELGIRVIITDHHEMPDSTPCADAVIDPKQTDCSYPFREICGGGVAYKFVQALAEYRGMHEEKLLDDLLQYAGMATVADIVPLQDENRIFAAEGIKRLRTTDNTGLNALMAARSVDKAQLNAGDIGFILGPCINSAGRLKNAIIAYHLLEEQNDEKARELACELSELNEMRRNLTLSQSAYAMQLLQERAEINGFLEKVLVVYLPEAHESVAGIIAGRIKDEYQRPAIVVTGSEDGLKGSGRSTEPYDMIRALKEVPELFIRYGGHAKACGFTLKIRGSREETVRNFSQRLNEKCTLQEKDLEKTIRIDMQLPFKYVTESFVQELSRLEPFGIMNEKPVFAGRNIQVLSSAVMGKKRNALKLYLEDEEGYRISGILFGSEEEIRQYYEEISQNPVISALFYPVINEFRGNRSLQIQIRSLQIRSG